MGKNIMTFFFNFFVKPDTNFILNHKKSESYDCMTLSADSGIIENTSVKKLSKHTGQRFCSFEIILREKMIFLEKKVGNIVLNIAIASANRETGY